jgi:AcrR family transcriptional regulator
MSNRASSTDTPRDDGDAGRGVGRGAPGKARVPRREREREMLAAAAEVFGERGYHGASMDQIAARAGITKPMLYSYFDSKEGLFAACGEIAATLLTERVREAAGLRELAPDERLWRGLVSVFEFIGEHRELWFAFNAPAGTSAPPDAGAVVARGRDAVNSLLEQLLTSAAIGEGVAPDAAAEAAPLAHALTASVLAMAEWWMGHPDEPAELQALRVMNFAWMGFGRLLQGKIWLPKD